MITPSPRLLFAIGLAGCLWHRWQPRKGGGRPAQEESGDRFEKSPPPPTPPQKLPILPKDANIYKTIIQGRDPESGVSYEVRFSRSRRYDDTGKVIGEEPVPDLLYAGLETFDSASGAVFRLAKNAKKGDPVAAAVLRQIDPTWIGLTSNNYGSGWEFPAIHSDTSNTFLELSRFQNVAALEFLRQGVEVNPWFLGALIQLCLEERDDACRFVQELDPKNYKKIPRTDKATFQLVEGGLLTRCAEAPDCRNPQMQPPWENLFGP